MNKDLEHLKWLSVGFYVYAGLTALFACFPIFHLVLGIAMVRGEMDNGPKGPPILFGWFFVIIASVFILAGWATAIATFLAGRFLKKQKNYTFIFVMAIINCMFAPVGTALGVFTIIVLLRDPVKALFEGKDPSQFETATVPDWK